MRLKLGFGIFPLICFPAITILFGSFVDKVHYKEIVVIIDPYLYQKQWIINWCIRRFELCFQRNYQSGSVEFQRPNVQS